MAYIDNIDNTEYIDNIKYIDNINPATSELIARIPVTTEAELTEAVSRARSVQAAWAAQPTSARLECLANAAAELGQRSEEFAQCITREMGKPIEDARREVAGWAGAIPKELEEVAQAIEPELFSSEGSETRLVRDPHGVVAAITPWNFPLGMPLQILVPALGTGNAVVFKPSEEVPETGALLAEVLQKHLPEGVLQLVQGAGDVGARLVESDIDMIAFVGSRATGKHIMKSASGGLKRLVLELGGKDPMVVFADADLDAAAECATRHSLRNTGQVCCSVERVYVDDQVAEAFEAKVVELAQAWTHGPGTEEGVRMGPLVNRTQRERVDTHVRDAVQNGARTLLGARLPEGPGWFYPATVLAGVTEACRMSQEETFGPVVSLSTFDGSEAEAIRLANDTPYGLGANVWTGDEARGLRVASAIRAGQVGVNRYLGGAPGTPWVGARQSGFGYLGGIEGHRQFTVPKSISRPVAASV